MIRVFQRREVAGVGEPLTMCDIWTHSVNENMKLNFVKISWNPSVNDFTKRAHSTLQNARIAVEKSVKSPELKNLLIRVIFDDNNT